jgi:hypothetical protein
VLMPGAIGSAWSKTGRKHQQQGWEEGLWWSKRSLLRDHEWVSE